MEMIRDIYKNSSLLGIENILCSSEEVKNPKYKAIIEEFFEYLLDVAWGFLEQERIDVKFSHLFVHGNIFANSSIFQLFGEKFEENCGYMLKKSKLISLVDKDLRHDECVTYGLALTASELLLVKKDPLIRILRYVLYTYE